MLQTILSFGRSGRDSPTLDKEIVNQNQCVDSNVKSNCHREEMLCLIFLQQQLVTFSITRSQNQISQKKYTHTRARAGDSFRIDWCQRMCNVYAKYKTQSSPKRKKKQEKQTNEGKKIDLVLVIFSKFEICNRIYRILVVLGTQSISTINISL